MCKLLEDTIKTENDMVEKKTTAKIIGRLLEKMTPEKVIELGFSKEEIALAQNYTKGAFV